LVVGNAGQAILPPAVGTRARLVMGKVVPGITPFAVVLADRPPLAFAEVRSPSLPGHLLVPGLVESHVFCGHDAPAFDLKMVSRACPCNARGPARVPLLPSAGMVAGGPRRCRRKARARSSLRDRARSTADTTCPQRGPPLAS